MNTSLISIASSSKGHGTKYADRIVSLTPNIIEVSEVLAEGGIVESALLVNRYVFDGDTTTLHGGTSVPYLIGQREGAEEALALAATFVTSRDKKVVIVRARSIDDARVLFGRSKGIAY